MNPPRKSVIHSPWYWVYLFATAALVALAVMGPKFSERQSQIERNYQGRLRANQQAQGESPHGKMSTPDDTIISLRPLYVGLGLVIIISWILIWRTHFRVRTSSPSPSAKAQAITHD